MLDYILFLFLFLFYLGLGFSMILYVTCHCHCDGHMIMWSQWNIVEHSEIIILYNMLNTY